MVYSAPGALPKKMVLVCIGADQRSVLCNLQHLLANKFMAFAYGTQNDESIPSLGDDNSPVYGYAQEHHTVKLWLNIWKEHAKNVQEYGTPPPCRRLLDLSTSFWNKCMGNVDTVRKVVKNVKALHGPDSGPGSLMWYTIFDYIFYNSFRIFQYA